jgi:FkbM family methyltransferase
VGFLGMSDYSQDGEQAVIIAHSGKPGVFLDIGANDGVSFSNTRALVDLGWQGVHVEPGTAAFAKLKQNLPNACAFQVAVSDKDGEAAFHESDANSRHMVSSLVESELQRWNCYTFATVQVKTVTVASLLKLAKLSRVDFLSIDAEGSDLLIFRQFDLSALGVRLVCVEHNGRDITPFDTHAASHGMKRIFKNAANVIYLKT